MIRTIYVDVEEYHVGFILRDGKPDKKPCSSFKRNANVMDPRGMFVPKPIYARAIAQACAINAEYDRQEAIKAIINPRFGMVLPRRKKKIKSISKSQLTFKL